MERLANKRVLLGVTGSIAAYKSGDIIRRLREVGAEVRVVMTQGASEFVTPLTFQALSGQRVYQYLFTDDSENGMDHIELARWADTLLVAPASADFIARLAQGRATDLLTAVCLASSVPLALAPAMNRQMWEAKATKANVRSLRSRGVLLFGPESGSQACGDIGAGRMQDPEEMLANLAEVFQTGSLTGKTVLVTAGPTREAIDPVRFLSNYSSGKMGFSVAAAAAEAGARVTLISGPSHEKTPSHVERHDVVSAQEMMDSVLAHIHGTDIFIAVAAVADYRPSSTHKEKLKKKSAKLMLTLERTPDILATVKSKFPNLFCVGFAAETSELSEGARNKLHGKGVDMIAANWVGEAAVETSGSFDSDVNALRLFWRGGEQELPVAPKPKLARELLAVIVQRYEHQQSKAPSITDSNVVPLKGPNSRSK